MLVYIALALAVALVLRRGDGPGVLAGSVLGVTLVCGYALATRLFPDRLERTTTRSTRTDSPSRSDTGTRSGCWRRSALLVGARVRGARPSLSGGRWPPPRRSPSVATTLYFTFSRGAWAALVDRLRGRTVVLDPRRLRLLWRHYRRRRDPSVLAIAYASRVDALTTEDAPRRRPRQRDGHRVAVVLAVATLCPAALAIVASDVTSLAARRTVSRRARRALRRRAVAVLGGGRGRGLVARVARCGGRRSSRTRFNAEPVGGVDLNERLFSVSGNGRSEQLRVAWDAGRERPFVGNGAGTFEYLWYERRPNLLVVRDAHSLYMETFAELGVVGLVARRGASAPPARSRSVRARRTRFVAPGLGALLALDARRARSTGTGRWSVSRSTALLVGSRRTRRRRTHDTRRVASGRRSGGARWQWRSC